MNKTTIYFMRHGQVHNPKQILYGRKPGFPLSLKGKEDINKLAQILKNFSINRIYTSPILRTYQTAQIIGRILNITPQKSQLLIETNVTLAGISLTQFQKEVEPNLYNQKYLNMGQESIKSQENRMLKFIKRILLKHKGETILAVSHGDPIMILRAKVSGIPFTFDYKKSHYIKKGDYFILEIEGINYTWRK